MSKEYERGGEKCTYGHGESSDESRESRNGGGCFIVTAVYGDPMASEVVSLREFRDETLKKYRLGRAFITAYYKTSPPIASWLLKKPKLSHVVRSVLNQAIRWI